MIRSDILSMLSENASAYRKHIIKLAQSHKGGIHIGGALSMAEILTTLYFQVAELDPKNPDWEDRDRIILSKGHGNIGLLTILAMKGFFSFDVFENLNQVGSFYSMHCDSHVAGVEHSAGSLGHGLAVSVGMALVSKREKKPWRVYCILGDGESMEGSVWEAMMSASHFGLNNLTAILDRNRLSQEGPTEKTMRLEPLAEKISAFGWSVIEVNGHNIEDLLDAFSADTGKKPKLILANTVKGRGVPVIEDQVKSHFGTLTEDQASMAIKQLTNEQSVTSG